MKTALQELISELRKSSKISSHPEYAMGLEYAAACAMVKLEKEKQQIIDGYYIGFDDGIGPEENQVYTGSEDYYNKTFKTES